ncbi:hypothetical protein B0T25DRAFT_360473 [Lasiosphaeria hispida]|uniref:Uncharacterized protein n=1 Tax=Lasiosphaeria hispida TaxID=260671 RepID=A0AAJ0H7Q5_9PEZI|nr:hypothetical protein B0T25DRAFT_360473 [Lasiosphaeria hispida]
MERALESSAYFDRQGQNLGSKLIGLHPGLPSIHLWLKRIRDDLRVNIMQLLNYQGRAISFWGLRRAPTFTEPGPLKGYLDLQNSQRLFRAEFRQRTESAVVPMIINAPCLPAR